jgi:acyl dehydratase
MLAKSPISAACYSRLPQHRVKPANANHDMTVSYPPASTLDVWDDFEPGKTYLLDTFAIDPSQCAAFATAFGGTTDGRPSPVFMTARLMRAVTDGYLAHAQGLGAGGVTHVDWPTAAPLGEPLTATMLCESKRALNSRPGVGLTVLRYDVTTARGDCVISWRANQFLRIAGSDMDTGRSGATPEIPEPVPFELPAYATALGAHTFTRAEIIAFAERYDPQAFHLDETAAARSLFGALCASGWHTTAVWYRMLLDHETRGTEYAAFGTSASANASSPPSGPSGFRDVTWRRPVYVGETITFFETGPDDSNETEGSARTFHGVNQAGTPVFSITAVYD